MSGTISPIYTVGKALCEKLQSKGYDVAILSRSKKNNTTFKTYLWNPSKNQIDSNAISSSDYIIHLAGANIAEKKWTASRKQLILDSRVQSANLIFNEVRKQKKELKAFISASAVGYHGLIHLIKYLLKRIELQMTSSGKLA